MPCEICKTAPRRRSQYEEVEDSPIRHGALYRCRSCGSYFEIIAEERGISHPSMEEISQWYPRTAALIASRRSEP